jgi:hypothetical protein
MLNFNKKYLKYKNKYFKLKQSIRDAIYHDGKNTKLDENDMLNNIYLVHAFSCNTKLSELFDFDIKQKTIKYKSFTKYEKYIHTSWGTLISPHLNEQWDQLDFALIVPLKNQVGKIYFINPNETIVSNSLTVGVPNNSFFVYNKKKLVKSTKNESIAEEDIKSMESIGFKSVEYKADKYTYIENREFINEIAKQLDYEINDNNKFINKNKNDDLLPVDIIHTISRGGKSYIFNFKKKSYNEDIHNIRYTFNDIEIFFEMMMRFIGEEAYGFENLFF